MDYISKKSSNRKKIDKGKGEQKFLLLEVGVLRFFASKKIPIQNSFHHYKYKIM